MVEVGCCESGVGLVGASQRRRSSRFISTCIEPRTFTILTSETYAMGKRKNQAQANGQAKKKRALSEDEAHKNFRNGLFESKVRDGYTDYYAKSRPYDTTLAFGALRSDDCLVISMR